MFNDIGECGLETIKKRGYARGNLSFLFVLMRQGGLKTNEKSSLLIMLHNGDDILCIMRDVLVYCKLQSGREQISNFEVTSNDEKTQTWWDCQSTNFNYQVNEAELRWMHRKAILKISTENK